MERQRGDAFIDCRQERGDGYFQCTNCTDQARRRLGEPDETPLALCFVYCRMN